MDNEQIADDLERAADVLAERGRCLGTVADSDGHTCVMGAVGLAVDGDFVLNAYAKETRAHREALTLCLRRNAGRFGLDENYPFSVIFWNDEPSTTDDDVFDLLRLTAKELRDEPVCGVCMGAGEGWDPEARRMVPCPSCGAAS